MVAQQNLPSVASPNTEVKNEPDAADEFNSYQYWKMPNNNDSVSLFYNSHYRKNSPSNSSSSLYVQQHFGVDDFAKLCPDDDKFSYEADEESSENSSNDDKLPFPEHLSNI